jgi:hypothetical protein
MKKVVAFTDLQEKGDRCCFYTENGKGKIVMVAADDRRNQRTEYRKGIIHISNLRNKKHCKGKRWQTGSYKHQGNQ